MRIKSATYQWDATERTFRVVPMMPIVGGMAEFQDMLRRGGRCGELSVGLCVSVEVGACICRVRRC